jgi:hypothetical protein
MKLSTDEIARFVHQTEPRKIPPAIAQAAINGYRLYLTYIAAISFAMCSAVIFFCQIQLLPIQLLPVKSACNVIAVLPCIVITYAIIWFYFRNRRQIWLLLIRGRFTHGNIAEVHPSRLTANKMEAAHVVVVFIDKYGRKRSANCDVFGSVDKKRCMLWNSDQTEIGLLYLNNVDKILITDLLFKG